MRSSFLLIFISLFSVSYSQLDNSSLFFNTEIDTTKEQALYVKIQNLNFMKNNEYSGTIADGFTLFGYQFNPQIGYQISKNLSIEGGIFLNKDFGNDNFTQVLPTFSVRYHKKDFKMLFGNLDGSINHQMIEPLYNFERLITNRLENGFQFKGNKKHFDYDVWVNWLSMIYRYSNYHEKIFVGINSNIYKFNGDKWEFKLPFQTIVIHSGGQIDTVHDGSTTDFNSALGVVLNYKSKLKYLQNVYVDTRYVLRSNNFYHSPIVIHSLGDGILANIGFNSAHQTNVVFSYWYCDNYYNEFGGDLYSSKSRTVAYPYYSERIRELFFIRVTKKIPLAKGINLTLRAEPYFDLRSHFFEYSYGFYINIDEKLWLKTKLNTSHTD